MAIIGQMSDDKPKPVDDLKEGLGLLFRAAKGAVERLPTDKLEDVAKDAVKEVGRAFESIGTEIEKVVGKVSGSPQPPPPAPPPGYAPPPAEGAEAKKDEAPPPAEPPKYDDGYAPEPPKGPRVG
ncbi:MAG: hypothetical protein BGO98_22400 [Myxococcales bacterium 68-20]|nr:hypothetical protein [Myxococcales bacterium]OJY15199.1 MAG: hypothetical protein BGO98_22400 [Myxococcales bacterium 68-20]